MIHDSHNVIMYDPFMPIAYSLRKELNKVKHMWHCQSYRIEK